MNKPVSFNAEHLGGGSVPGFEPHERTLRELAHDVTPAVVEIWRGLMLRKWLILAIVLVVTGATVFVVQRMTPIYRSTATVLVEQQKNKVVSIDEVYGGISGNREYFQTQAEFLKSRDVALRVVRKVGLSTHPEFDPRQHKPPAWQFWADAQAAKDLDEETVESLVVARVQARANIAPVRLSQLVKIHFESADRRLAAEVANEIADAYIRADMDARFTMTQQANVWLSTRLSELKQKLDASEKALQDYREKAGIADTKGLAQGGQSKQVEEMGQRLVEARVKRTQAEENFRQVQGTRADRYTLPAIVNHPSVASAKVAESTAEQKFAEIRQKYGPAFPTYKEAEKELEAARANTRRQADAIVSSIEKEYRVARANERALEESLQRSRGSIQQVNRKEIDLSNYEREVTTNKQLYETFLARVKETNAAGDIQTAVARVVDPAVAELKPVKPQKPQIVAAAFAASLLGAAMLAFLLNRMDNTLKTTEAVEQRLGETLLGALPKLGGPQERKATRLMIEEPNSAFAEAVRTVNTGILLSTLDTQNKIVAITSSLPEEGKSTLATNLALAQAKTKRVLLIDSDLRRPVLAARLGIQAGEKGLTELLAGQAGAEVIRTLEGTDLKMLPAGKLPPNPLELLATDRFKEVLATLRASFDLIVIDCPPLQLVSDALIIGSEATGLIYVAEAGRTPVPLIRRNLKRVRDADVRLFGIVLNGYSFAHAERYYGEYSGYSKYGSSYYGSKS